MDTLSKYPTWFRERIFLTLAHDSWQGLSREELNLLYNAADIYVQNSSEGFGLTVAEAIACGVPAVGIDYSAVPEVIGPAGLVGRVSHLVDNEYDHFWSVVDPVEWGNKVEYLVRHPSKRRAMGALGPGHVRANFSWQRAAEQFKDLVYAAAQDRSHDRLETVSGAA
jgi:glycosyltransferase involved in cell wall biosynthesis